MIGKKIETEMQSSTYMVKTKLGGRNWLLFDCHRDVAHCMC
jgi:hypothetical protein